MLNSQQPHKFILPPQCADTGAEHSSNTVCRCRSLLVVLWLFWEAYFATVGATVTVGNWVFAVVQRWQYQRKWGSRASGKQQ